MMAIRSKLKKAPGGQKPKQQPKAAAKPAAPSPAAAEPQRTDNVAAVAAATAAVAAKGQRDIPVSTEFDDDSSITYEGSRIPWWVRLMWVAFWVICLYYIAIALPDAARYFD